MQCINAEVGWSSRHTQAGLCGKQEKTFYFQENQSFLSHILPPGFKCQALDSITMCVYVMGYISDDYQILDTEHYGFVAEIPEFSHSMSHPFDMLSIQGSK